MTAYTTISNALVAVGGKPFATTIQALRDNLLGAMEGDATAVAAGVTLKDPALDTGAATAQGTAWVGLRTAGLAVGAVGAYAFLQLSTPAIQAPGFTTAGSNLNWGNAAGGVTGSPSGTWMLCGRIASGSAELSTSSWRRIS